jgi:hypothetical protein
MRCKEYKLGLFINPEGNAFDFHSVTPTIANFPLTKTTN